MRKLSIVICIIILCLAATGFSQRTAARSPISSQITNNIIATHTAVFTTPGEVNTLIPLDNGQMLVGGKFITIGGQSTPQSLAIINNDGTVETSFLVDPDLLVNEISAAVVQSDGKIVIAGWFTKLPSVFTDFILRFNPDGSIDDTFNPPGIYGRVFDVLLDGNKIVIVGNFNTPTPYIARLNQDGSEDTTFDGIGNGPDDIVRSIARQSDNKYVIAGDFGSYDNTPQVGVARINADGSLDTSFVAGGFRTSEEIAVLNDDSVIVGGTNICGDEVFAWYTAEGDIKPVLDPNPDLFQAITSFLPLSDGGFLVGGWYSTLCVNTSPTEHNGQVWRFASDGSYHSMVSYESDTDILTMALRDDGKVIIGGQGNPENASVVGLFDGLALIDLGNSSVEKDDTFHPLVGDEAEIASLSQYPDGKMLVAGNFSHVDGYPLFGVARLHATGALDTSFQPFADQPGGWSHAALALPDGRAVAGYGYSELYLIDENDDLTDLSTLIGYDRATTLALHTDGGVLVGTDFGLGVRRLAADFSGIDGTFIPGDAVGSVYDITVEANGDILVAGDFEEYNNVDVNGLVRLNNDGSIDFDFAPPVFMATEYLTATLSSVTPLADNQVLVGGDFTTVNGDDFLALVRLNNDGSQDTTFASPIDFKNVKSVCLQGDGSIWVGGEDNSFITKPLVQHFTGSGEQDPEFQSNYLASHYDGIVNAVLCDDDGLTWTAGLFGQIDGSAYYSLARYAELVDQVFLPNIQR